MAVQKAVLKAVLKVLMKMSVSVSINQFKAIVYQNVDSSTQLGRKLLDFN